MKHLNAAYVFSVSLPVVAMCAFMVTQPRLAIDLQNLVFDSYQRISPRLYDPESPVRIVDIDDESLERLGQWPWPRTILAELVSRLRAGGAAVTAFDVGFAEADRNSPETILAGIAPGPTRDAIERELILSETNDTLFARELANGPVVLGAILVDRPRNTSYSPKFGMSEAGDPAVPFLSPYQGVVLPLAMLSDSAAGVGALNWVPDRDQIIRKVPLFFALDSKAVPSLVAESLRIGQGAQGYIVRSSNASGQYAFGRSTGINTVKIGQLQIVTGSASDVRPRFSATEPRRFIPAWKILADQVAKDEIEGRIIFIGTSAAGLRDQRATPIDASVPGVEVHAQLIENILDDKVLIRPDWALGLELLVTIVLSMFIATALPITSPLVGALGGGILALSISYTSFEAFETKGLLLDAIVPSLTGGLVYLSGIFYLWRQEKAQRRYVRSAFGKYVSPAVVEQLVNNPDKLAIGGETRVLTVMFVDLRSFTTISEGMDAPAITKFMNEYLTPLTDIIIEENGTVDKYMGDAIMAFWNAPLDDANHARNAVAAALRMRDALAQLNLGWQAVDEAAGRKPKLVKFGIGLNTGPCSVGNMGSLRRFDYSAMGDSVNLASRLESASKQYGIDILVNETTMVAAPSFAWLEVDRLRVKGKTASTTVFGLMGDATLNKNPLIGSWLSQHAMYLQALKRHDLHEAVAMIEPLSKMAPPQVGDLYARLKDYLALLLDRGVPADWDGARSLDEK